MLDSPIDPQQAWTLPVPVASSASSAAAIVPDGVDPAFWASLFSRSSTSEPPSIIKSVWMPVSPGTYRPALSDNASVSIIEYHAFDDQPHAILASISPESYVGRVGYWHSGAPDSLILSDAISSAGMILERLSSLKDGWCGLESLAPSSEVKRDIARTYYAAGIPLPDPLLEVADDGSVALLWERDEQAFALNFFGNGKVVATLSPRPRDFAPKAIPADDSNKLRLLFASRLVAQFFA